MKQALLLLILFTVAGCVAKSGNSTRFGESGVLSALSFTPALADSNRFTFAIVGDTHVGGTDTARLNRIFAALKAEGDAFVVLLGDIVDKGSRESFSAVNDSIKAAGLQGLVLPVIGNHDVFEDGWLSYKDFFGPSHYTLTIGNSRFIALDTADGTVGQAQEEWLQSELSKPAPTNTFVLSHYLPVIPGQRTYLKFADEMEGVRLMKLVQTHSVRAWLGAHYHSFISDSIEGVQYVVAGGGGGRRMEPIKDFFFVQVSVANAGVTYTLRRVD